MSGSDHQTIVSKILQYPSYREAGVRYHGAAALSMRLNDAVDQIATLPLELFAEQPLNDLSNDGPHEW
jgi:hypothetical protein